MTKEDFLIDQSNEPKKKLNKKQAKKMAKKNNTVNGSTSSDNDQLVQDMTQISLESTPVEQQEQNSDQEEDGDKVMAIDKDENLPPFNRSISLSIDLSSTYVRI